MNLMDVENVNTSSFCLNWIWEEHKRKYQRFMNGGSFSNAVRNGETERLLF